MLSDINRREFIGAAAAFNVLVALRGGAAMGQEGVQFGRPMVIEMARKLAAAPFAAPEPAVPEALRNVPFSDYQRIQAREESRLFAEPPSGFSVEPLHSGFIYREPVELFTVRGDQVLKVVFSPDSFAYPQIEGLPPEGPLEFAGFRGLTALDAPDSLTPFVVFAGASYFQAISRGPGLRPQRARPRDRHRRAGGRGISVLPRLLDRAARRRPHGRPRAARQPERRPAPTASPSGPGDATVIDVEATLFAARRRSTSSASRR